MALSRLHVLAVARDSDKDRADRRLALERHLILLAVGLEVARQSIRDDLHLVGQRVAREPASAVPW